jgi:8-oxo-dGTP diphosphatase
MRVKRSVALAIRDPGRPGQVLLVQRPADDEDLPDVWGLPAASLTAEESWEEAALRAGREKLGVVLELAGVLRAGSRQRAAYRLDMRLYAAAIRSGEPAVPRADASVTQYQAWRWGTGVDLRPAAARGSLCSRLYLAADS